MNTETVHNENENIKLRLAKKKEYNCKKTKQYFVNQKNVQINKQFLFSLLNLITLESILIKAQPINTWFLEPFLYLLIITIIPRNLLTS